MMTPFLALVRKELQLFFLDRRAVLMSVVAPIAIASFFGYIFGGGAGDAEKARIPVFVSDLDNTPFSRDIVSRLGKESLLDVKPASENDARSAVSRGRVTAAIIIPSEFGPAMASAFMAGGPKPSILLLGDPSRGMETKMVEGVVWGAVLQAAGRQIAGQATGRDGIPMPFQINSQTVTGTHRLYNGYAHAFGGMGIQFLLMVGVEVGISLLMRRQQGAWKRLRAAPLSRAVVLGSRITASAITSMGTLVILFAFARVVFGVRIEGSLAGFIGICLAFSLMTACFGLFIAAIGKTAESTRAIAILTTLLMVMLGGAWVPTFIFPRWLQTLTVAIPTRWAMDGLDAVTWRGLGFSSVVLPIILLFACAAALGSIAVVRFRWEAD